MRAEMTRALLLCTIPVYDLSSLEGYVNRALNECRPCRLTLGRGFRPAFVSADGFPQ